MHVPFWVKIKTSLFPNRGREDVLFCILFVFLETSLMPYLYSFSFYLTPRNLLFWILDLIQSNHQLRWQMTYSRQMWDARSSSLGERLPLAPLSYSSGAFEDAVRTITRSQLRRSNPSTCLCPCDGGLISERNTAHSKFLTLKWLSGT